VAPTHSITAGNVDALVAGVRLLGSGGGGDPTSFAKLLKRRLGPDRIDLHTPDDLAGNWVTPVGIVGSTSVFLEKLPSGRELTSAVEAVCRWAGVEANAVMGLEAGGLNGIAAMVASLDVGLPFLDADLMGRALPRLDQLSWAVEGLPITPCALCEPGGQVVIVDEATPQAVERTARAFVSETGGWAALALSPRAVPTAAPVSVLGSAARALSLGTAHAGLDTPPTPESVEVALGGRVLATGRVREVTRYDRPGAFSRGSVTVVDSRSGAVVRVEAENEFLLALVDGRPEASTPDLLCVLDRRTAHPLAADGVRVGDDTLVVVLPGPPWWASRGHRLAAVGPAAYGLDTEPALLRVAP
jgi:DUF917 family protein